MSTPHEAELEQAELEECRRRYAEVDGRIRALKAQVVTLEQHLWLLDSQIKDIESRQRARVVAAERARVAGTLTPQQFKAIMGHGC
jgi:predicted  nucleic acid-binding Zn-ribbon protein